MNKTYLITLSYRGTRFFGWQSQTNIGPTVQDELNKALKVVFKSKEVRSLGSGRTDRGVHANALSVKIWVPFEILPQDLPRALNTKLPEDIRVIKAAVCEESFHPVRDTKMRSYLYLFSNLEHPSALQYDLIPNVSYDLDFKSLQECLALYKGEHDFQDFHTQGSEFDTTVKTIYEVNFQAVMETEICPSHYKIYIQGNGFLKQMVRLLVGTALDVARGKLAISQVKESLSSPKGRPIGHVAAAFGLYKL